MSMAEISPTNQRLDALFRVLLLAVYSWTVYPVVLTIGLVGGLVFMVVDVILQLIRGNEGLTSGSISSWGKRLFMWPLDQLGYIIGTTSKFPLLP